MYMRVGNSFTNFLIRPGIRIPHGLLSTTCTLPRSTGVSVCSRTSQPVLTQMSRSVANVQSKADNTVGSQYQKKSQREHILLRPEPYLGAIDMVTEKQWILSTPFLPHHKDMKLDLADATTPRIVESEISFNPALYKIVDEILVNAADNVHRSTRQSKMTYIDVQVDIHTGEISIENNGASIPIVIHPEEKVYVPELIFGHLLTSSNYNDNVERFTGGRHGFGAKLTNIFSKKFKLDIVDDERKLYYSQVFEDNMSIVHPPKIEPNTTHIQEKPYLNYDKSTNYTRISFIPDYAKFPSMENGLDMNILRLIHRRVVDLAASLGKHNVKVYFNHVEIPITNFAKYLQICPIFVGEGNTSDDVVVLSEDTASLSKTGSAVAGTSNTDEVEDMDSDIDNDTDTENEDQLLSSKGRLLQFELSPHWYIAITPRHDDDPHTFASMRHLSFVNNIATTRGGTHVSYIADTIARYICNYINERKKKYKIASDINIGQVKSRMSLLVACYIPNPAFDSQTKELLMTPIRAPGAYTLNTQNTSKPSVEGIKIPENVLLKICKTSGIIGLVTEYMQTKETRDVLRKLDNISKTTRNSDKHKLLSIEKLEDAHLAGGPQSKHCTLILTEGDSAKALALSGLSVLGRDKYGIYPLRGKLLNVREASHTQLHNNKEIMEIVQILGLKYGTDYKSQCKNGELPSTMRYGHVVIMADQDHDGSHIKGLLLNLFHSLWPGLFQIPNFLRQFVTPIVKVKYDGAGPIPLPTHPDLKITMIHKTNKGIQQGQVIDNSTLDINTTTSTGTNSSTTSTPVKHSVTANILCDGKTLSFYNLQDYQLWKDQVPAHMLNKYKIKYYKGLGTSTSAEGKEYFSLLQTHMIDFLWKGEEDAKALELAFAKDKADERKVWLQNIKDILQSHTTPNANIKDIDMDEHGNIITKDVHTHAIKKVSVSDFVNHELIHFSVADNLRSIPSLIDGLKPGQRKILYGCFKRNLTKDVKVAQLSGYVAEHTGYHHGEQSLNMTIVAMAQNYPFSNNLALLQPLGQFGTRSMGGKDSASARYIFTKLSGITKYIYRDEDSIILQHNDDDGLVVEPVTYYPIIPMVLVNGSVGIGTGYSTNIPSYHPLDIIDRLYAHLHQPGTPMKQLVPWANGYYGMITPETTVSSDIYPDGIVTKFTSTGKYTLNVKKHSLHITELPWGVWNNTYKQFLISLLETTKSKTTKSTDTSASASSASSTVSRSKKSLEPTISYFTEHHTEDTVSFHVFFKKEEFARLLSGDIVSSMKLQSSINLSNMHVFNTEQCIQAYMDPRDMIAEYAQARLHAYEQRKQAMLLELQLQLALAKSRLAFIKDTISGALNLTKKKKDTLVLELFSKGYVPFNMKLMEKASTNTTKSEDGNEEVEDEDEVAVVTNSSSSSTSSSTSKRAAAASGQGSKQNSIVLPSTYTNLDDIYNKYNIAPQHRSGVPIYKDTKSAHIHMLMNAYDYLLALPLSSITLERVEAIEQDTKNMERKVQDLLHTTPKDLWIKELAQLRDMIIKTEKLSENINDPVRQTDFVPSSSFPQVIVDPVSTVLPNNTKTSTKTNTKTKAKSGTSSSSSTKKTTKSNK